MDKQKIGLVLPNAPGFSETFFNSKIQGLQDAGFEVMLFVNSKGTATARCEVVKAYKVHSNNPPLQFIKILLVFFKLMFSAPQSLLRFIRLERKDGISWKRVVENVYINAHILSFKLKWLHFGFVTMALRSENVARAMGARMAVSFRGYDISVYPIKHPNCYHKLWPKVDKVHTISDDLYQLALRQGLPPQVPVVKITPAIDVQTFSQVRKNTPIAMPLQILSVARLHWKKGFEYGLSAMAILKQRGVAFQYTIVGTGMDHERLVFAANQLGIIDQVKFLGRKTSAEVAALMATADIYLQPSVQEGFCNAVLEAQAAGCICVVSDAEGLSENVLHSRSGFVVPKRDPAAIADTIASISQKHHVEIQHMREFAVNRVAQEFDIKQQMRKFTDFYNS